MGAQGCRLGSGPTNVDWGPHPLVRERGHRHTTDWWVLRRSAPAEEPVAALLVRHV
jgi:hypothetical protein